MRANILTETKIWLKCFIELNLGTKGEFIVRSSSSAVQGYPGAVGMAGIRGHMGQRVRTHTSTSTDFRHVNVFRYFTFDEAQLKRWVGKNSVWLLIGIRKNKLWPWTVFEGRRRCEGACWCPGEARASSEYYIHIIYLCYLVSKGSPFISTVSSVYRQRWPLTPTCSLHLKKVALTS